MSLYHLMVFPMKAGSSILLDQANDYIPADLVTYQRLVRKPIYLACKTMQDIAFIVRQLSCHNSDS